MQVKFSFTQFAIALGIKMLSMLGFGILIFAVYFIQSDTRASGFQMGMIELLIGLLPVYLFWALLFVPLRSMVVKQSEGSLMPEFLLVLGLNLMEHFFMFGNFASCIRNAGNQSWDQTLLIALPDFPEFTALLLSSIFFTLVYRSVIAKKNGLPGLQS